MNKMHTTRPSIRSISHEQIFTLICLALLIAASSCSPKDAQIDSATDAPAKLRIGAVLPLTGAASIHGQNEREGLELARKEINKAGGIAGKQVDIIYEDDQTDSAKSVTAVKKLIELDNVKLIIGGTWDFLANAEIPVIDQDKAVLISPSARPDTITRDSDYFFVMHSPVLLHERAIEKWIDITNVSSIIAVVVDNPWGAAHIKALRAAARAKNITIIEERMLPSFESNDISTEVTKVKALRADGLFAIMNFNDNAMLAKKRIEQSIDIPILAGEDFLTALTSGKMEPSQAEGVSILLFKSDPTGFPARFEKEFNKPADIYSDTAYDSLYAIKAAIEKAGSQDPDQVIEALHEIEFDGASGKIFFGEKNFPENKNSVLGTIQDGIWVPNN